MFCKLLNIIHPQVNPYSVVLTVISLIHIHTNINTQLNSQILENIGEKEREREREIYLITDIMSHKVINSMLNFKLRHDIVKVIDIHF